MSETTPAANGWNGELVGALTGRPRIGEQCRVVPLAPISRALGRKPLSRAPEGRIWAIVVHPDDENAVLTPLAYTFLREEMSIRDDAVLVLTASGMVRRADWPDLPKEDLKGNIMERKYGVLYVDSGGGRLDQHARNENRAQSLISSAELVAAKYRPLDFLLVPLRSIARHDTRGNRLAKDTDFKGSSSPHTPRTFSILVKAWRKLVRTGAMHPARMVRNWFISFLALEPQIASAIKDVEQEDLDAALKAFNPKERGLFLAKNLARGAAAHFAETDLHPVEQARAVREFEADCEQAFALWEEEWLQGLAEFKNAENVWVNTFTTRIPVLKPLAGDQSQDLEPEPQQRAVALVTVHRASSERIGEVVRYHTKNLLKGFGLEPEVVVHTVRPEQGGRWTIAGQRAVMRDIAAALRIAEIIKSRGTFFGNEDPRALGPFYYRNRDGKRAEGAYAPSFQTAVGTYFDTNPDGIAPGQLTTGERARVALRVLSGMAPTFADRFACTDRDEPFCDRDCPLHRFEFAGCENFRAWLDEVRVRPADDADLPPSDDPKTDDDVEVGADDDVPIGDKAPAEDTT